jgi:hypothetical protein
MSELNAACWAIVSERGREAHGLTHRQALELIERLAREKVNGLCIVTDAAAGRFAQPAPASQPVAPNRTARQSMNN